MKRKWERIIAFLQIIGGIFGIGTVVLTIGYYATSFLTLVGVGVFFILFILSIVAGFLLWRNHSIGIILSILIQAIQIVRFAVGGYIYYFCSGLYIGPSLIESKSQIGFGFNFHFPADFQFGLGTQDVPMMIGVNLFAIFAMFYLLRSRKVQIAPQSVSVS